MIYSQSHAPRYLIFLIALLFLSACSKEPSVETVVQWHREGVPATIRVNNSDNQTILIKKFHLNGVRAEFQEMQNGKAHGLRERWNTDGIIQESVHLQQGIPHGEIRTWYRERTIESIGNLKMGKLDGERVFYRLDGTVRAKEYWKDGVAVGEWLEFYGDETQLKQQNTCHPQSNGIARKIIYNKEGKILALDSCLNGKLHGESFEKYPQFLSQSKTHHSLGNMVWQGEKYRGKYLEDKQTGAWYWFRADGTLFKKRQFTNGLLDGLQLDFNDNGDTILSSIFLNGTGQFKRTHSDSSWQNGVLHGLQTEWNEDKMLLHKDYWENGKKIKSISFRTDRKGKELAKLMEGQWENNKRHGTWMTWYSNGKVRDSLNYQKGELWGPQSSFDSTGHLYLRKIHSGKFGQVIVEHLAPH